MNISTGFSYTQTDQSKIKNSQRSQVANQSLCNGALAIEKISTLAFIRANKKLSFDKKRFNCE